MISVRKFYGLQTDSYVLRGLWRGYMEPNPNPHS